MSEYARLITENTRKARKDYHCDACELLFQDVEAGSEVEKGFTAEETAAYLKAKEEKGRIQKGTLYLNQTCEFDGFIYSFKARPEIWAIVTKYKINYPD